MAALVLAIATVLAYHGIDQNAFHFDDWPNIVDNASLHMKQFGVDGLLAAVQGAYLPRRPVATLSFAVDWWRGGGAPGAFLTTNLIIHVLTAWAIFAFMLRALTHSTRPTAPAVVACAAAALWWSVQPIHVQAVSYAVQRMTELATLFSVLSVWAYLKARASAGRGAALWGVLSALTLVLAALSKENAWITPLLILLAEYLVLRNRGSLIRHPRDRLLLALPAITVIGVLADILFGGPVSQWALSGYSGRSFTLGERLLTQPKVVLFHVSQILWPLPERFSLEHDVEIVRSAASWEFWLPMGVILAWSGAGALLAARPGTRRAGFFVLWVPVTLFIESSFVPLEMVFEHRMYMPTVGFTGLVAIGLLHAASRGPTVRTTGIWSAYLLATGFALWSTSERIPQWRTEASLYEQAVRLAPRSARAWNLLGVANLGQRRDELLTQERYERALSAFDRAIALNDQYAAPWTNRGVARYLQGDIPGAETDLKRAISISSREAAAQHYLGELYERTGRPLEARTARRRACALGVTPDCNR
ncbi:tetratricopeptide repeat protein [Aromatoleum toluclasticum]|uniref:tetratricopeptide repeat protein n=1 Tax=Aromatoleum toluclasticum TaxID=92003 RepID=UPI001D18F70B|nr:tetratricopeptide repeat protein [Aromatoleum toluclasticum]MCC4114271.1 tetratricopeptide repeat protein [Aromatoleum toluclasticum]